MGSEMPDNTANIRDMTLPVGSYVSNQIYSDPLIFEIEQKRIFRKVWKLACCESEIPNKNDFRTFSVASVPILIIRSADDVVRAFVNACSHRGAKIVDVPRGNARQLECPFHRWTYDSFGRCTTIPRHEAFASAGVDKSKCGLAAVRCESIHGLVFVNLDSEATPLSEWLDGCIEDVFSDLFISSELEVFHFHEQIVRTNWKHWQETNMELYHEYLHVLNRRTSMSEPAYFKRKWRAYSGGHATLDPMVVDYSKMKGMQSREGHELPGLKPNEFRLLDIFPDVMLNCRATVLRIDTQIPISPTETLVQFRGLGVRGEPEDVRAARIRDHAEFWGPFGRNLPEDQFAAERQSETMKAGASPISLIAREEDLMTQDDFPIREYYRQWSSMTGLDFAHPAVGATP